MSISMCCRTNKPHQKIMATPSLRMFQRATRYMMAGVHLICASTYSALLLPTLHLARANTKPPVLENMSTADSASERTQLPTPQIIRQSWRALGQGEMRWLGFKLYHATLWTPSGTWQANQQFALELRYARDIAAHRLVNASLEEMKRLHAKTLDEALQQRWSKHLQLIFPDVKAGEVIMGVSLPMHGAVFFHQNRLIGQINESAFAEQFFAIWLAPSTREPDLRRQLLGLN